MVPPYGYRDNKIGRAWDRVLNPNTFRVATAHTLADTMIREGRKATGITGTLLTEKDRHRLRDLPRLAMDWRPGAQPLAAVKEAYVVDEKGNIVRETAKRSRKEKAVLKRVAFPETGLLVKS